MQTYVAMLCRFCFTHAVTLHFCPLTAVDWRWERWFANPHWAPWADPGYGKHATFCFEDYVRSVHLRGDTVIASVGSVLVRDCSIQCVLDQKVNTRVATFSHKHIHTQCD